MILTYTNNFDHKGNLLQEETKINIGNIIGVCSGHISSGYYVSFNMDKHFYVIELDNMGGFNIFGNSGDGRDEHEFIATPTDTEADELRRYISQYIPEEYKNLS